MTAPPAPPRRSPFPGLTPFTRNDAAYFAGREREVAIVVDNLLAHPVSILFGPSGVGKSSLVRAGVLPRLEERDRTRRELIVGEPDGDDDLADEQAYTTVYCASWADGAAAGLRDELTAVFGDAWAAAHREEPLARLVADAGERACGGLLLVLDQFEEQFAGDRAPDPELIDALAEAGPAVHILIAIREDALGQLDRFDDAVPGLFDNLIRVDHLDLEAAREAIEQPVAAWNATGRVVVHVEPELIAAVLDGVSSSSSGSGDGGGDDDVPSIQAPYLQLVMTRLWEKQEPEPGGRDRDRVLRLAALVKLGGARKIVATHVDAAMASCSRREQRIAAAMLRHLVTPSGAKLPLRVADLADYAHVQEAEVARVVERLVSARILEPAGETHYQLSHDVLARPVRDWCEDQARQDVLRRERRRLFAIVCFVAGLLALAALAKGLDPLEVATVDARFALRGHRSPPPDLVVVRVDDRSMSELDTDWPVPRAMAGDAIDWIGEGDPQVIAYDVDFSSRRRDDVSLASAIKGASGRVVLAAEAIGPGGSANVLGGEDVLRDIGARAGYAKFAQDLTGVIHRPIHSVDGMPSFAVAAAETALGTAVPDRDFDRAWIDYYGPEGTLRSVPFAQVVRHAVPRSFFRDKLVVVGLTSPAFGDRHAVWGVHHTDMSGVEIQATAIDTLRRGLPLKSPPAWVSLALIVVCALLPPLLSLSFTLRTTLALSLLAAAVYLGAAMLAFLAGWVLLVVAPLAALLIAALAVALVSVTAPEDEEGWRAA